MPNIKVNGCNFYYEDSGSGKETIVFAHGLLFNGKMFAAQVEHLKNRYRVITYDQRGQGQSEVTDSGYDMDSLTDDAVALINALNAAPCHFAGLSMGGSIGMRLSARYPELVNSLILMDTTARAEPSKDLTKYKLFITVVKIFGTWPVMGELMKIMFGKKFLNDPTKNEIKNVWKRELKSNKKTITKPAEAVITRKGIESELSAIKCPTLIIVGDQDVAATPDQSRFIHQLIPQSKLVLIEGAGHSSPIEEPEEVNKTLDEFLKTI